MSKVCFRFLWKQQLSSGRRPSCFFSDVKTISLRSTMAVGSLLCSLCTWPALAVEPAEMLADTALETRARTVSRQLRCVVCQNESIDESNAELAHDMRLLVRELISAGNADEDVICFLVDRYGDFVTLMPPFRPSTWLLWLGPGLFLTIAVGIARRFLLRGRLPDHDPNVPLSDDEQRHLCTLMQENGGRE